MTWTPGPWEVYAKSYINAHGEPIATIDPEPNYEANARLIALAPEMAELLEQTVKAGEADSATIVGAMRLLARARGEA